MSLKLPQIGDNIKITSYKHNGQRHRTWDETTILHINPDTMIGGNFKTKVTEASGEVWKTKELAIAYFSASQWFNIVALISGAGVEYYCNLSSPAAWNGEALTYIDYDLDISVQPNGTLQVLDEDEFEINIQKMHYPEPIVTLVERAVGELKNMIEEEQGLFNKQELSYWLNQYEQYTNNKLG
mgnify:CR=1 FL=1